MSLFSTPYPNPTRTIAGVAQLYEDDVVLAVDTSALACVITLLEIPDNHWNTNWKLYLVPTQSVLSNNITISAGVGQTINGAASIVFSGPSNRIKITISSNNTFMAEIDSLSISPVIDSGWINLLGFDHLTGWTKRPQFRLVNKQLHFRGTIVVPLATDISGEFLETITYTGIDGFYAAIKKPFVYQGDNGCSLNEGILQFNKNANIFPPPYDAMTLRNEASFGLKMLTRTSLALIDNEIPILLHSLGELVVSSNKKLILKSYDNLQNQNQNTFIGGGTSYGGGHQLVTFNLQNKYLVNWNSAGSGSTNSAGVDTMPFTREFEVTGEQYAFTLNAEMADNLGGFQLILDGFYTFIE